MAFEKKILYKIFIFIFLFGVMGNVIALNSDNGNDNTEIDFEKRLAYYVNLNSRDFIQKLGVREQFLLQMIQNITKEVAERGPQNVFGDSSGYIKIYAEQNRLISEYSQEVENIVGLVNELEQLENYVIRTENQQILGEIQTLRLNLQAALENRQVYQKQSRLAKEDFSPDQALNLIDRYSTEIDSILDIYETLNFFEEHAKARNDAEILKEIEKQKRLVTNILGYYSPDADAAAGGITMGERIVEDYMEESDKIVSILHEIDKIAAKMNLDSTLNVRDARKVKSELVTSIDSRLLEISGYDVNTKYEGPKVSDFFDAWRAQKNTEYQAKLTEYQILYVRLISSGTEAQRLRMLERAMSDAMMNYSDREYTLAEMQFNDIKKLFGPYFQQMDGVLFYAGECNFAQSFYDAAMKNYDELYKSFPDSKFIGRALYKLMLITYTYDWKKNFFEYFEKLKDLPASIALEDMNNAYYLASYLYASVGKYKSAETYLTKIEKNSEYYLPGQYLLGIVYANLDSYNKAKSIFEMLSNKSNYPWTDVNMVTIRNEATIRLGFLHYQRGEYEKAISILNQVSKGFEKYDKGLIVQAWAKLKTGKYEESIQKVNTLFSDYVTSNHSYEALVLSAHCKQILEKPNEAKKDLKYVTSAHSVLDMSEDYNNERRRILEQAKELERLEDVVLDRQDKELYDQTTKIRQMINEALLSFNYQGFAGSQLLDEFNDERKEVLRQIEQFDDIIRAAQESGDREVLDLASNQRTRLIRILESHQEDKSVMNVNYFVEHPLATKEGGVKYRRGIMKKMFTDITDEKRRLERDIQMITDLLAKRGASNNFSAELDLEMLEDQLADLKNQLNRLQIWLATNPVPEMETNFEEWADFSGFGMSDINFTSYVDKDTQINAYSQNIATIDRLLARKRALLEQEITNYDAKMEKIEKKVENEKVRLEKLERRKYFENIYFDTKQQEVKHQTENEEFERMLEEELKRSRLEETIQNEPAPEDSSSSTIKD